MPKSKLLPLLSAQLLFFKEQRERFAVVALLKSVTVSELLLLLFTKEWLCAICSRTHDKTASDKSDLLFFMSESLFRSQKRNDSLEKPMSQFQTLVFTI